MTPPGTTTDTSGVRRAWGWVSHLRGGGTTPWHAWTGEQGGGSRLLPGAQQLELLRRVNLVGRPSAELAERVLVASAAGRGRPDLELEGAVERLRFGPPPVDPADLPDEELIRVAAGLVADDVVTAGLPEQPGPRRSRPWRTHYRLAGDPWLADPVRTHLIEHGRPPGGPGELVLVLAADLATMLADAWTARSFAEGAPDWRTWLDTWVQREQVAPRADVLAAARRWADQVGRQHVEIVLDPDALPRLVGLRRRLPAPPVVPAVGAELARQVASVLGLLVTAPEQVELLRRTLLPRLVATAAAATASTAAPLAVPPEHAEWLRRQAVRMRDGLLGDGYAVHGDPDALLPPTPGTLAGTTDPSEAGVLDLAVRLLLGPGPARDPGTAGQEETR